MIRKTVFDPQLTSECKNLALREKCPNTEFFLLCIFLYSGLIQENTDQKNLLIWTLFTQRRFRYLYFSFLTII